MRQVPSGSPGGARSPKPTHWPQGVLPVLLLVGLLVGLFLARRMIDDATLHKVTYSQFKNAIGQGVFAKVRISDELLKGFVQESSPVGGLHEGQMWLANRVSGDPELLKTLETHQVPFEAEASSQVGDWLWVSMLPLGLGFVLWATMYRRMSGGLGQPPQGVINFGKSRAKVRSESDTGVGFSDVAGIDEAVDELKEIVEFLKTPEKFRRLGGRIPKGVLLMGPPGTGKTLLARAVAGEAKVPFFSLSGSEFVEMFVGVGAARVRDLFAQAAARAPCIVFIDELDAIGKSRNSGVATGHDEREQTLNQLLAEMDGFDSKVGLIVLAATNRPEILDSALLRPGRFDRQVVVDRPDKQGREKILHIHSRQVKLAEDVKLSNVAAKTPGFGGAELANVVNEAALLAARKEHVSVLMADFDEAIERVLAGLEKKNRRINENEKEIVAHHEAGHAVVNWMLPHAERVRKVSIIPRGLAALGYTLSMPLEDRYLMSFEELRDKMAGMMGGRAAEELLVGTSSTGASNDFRQATEMARLMVCEFGMSQLGPVTYLEEKNQFLRSTGGTPTRGVSEQTARRIDEEVERLLREAFERAREVLFRHRERVTLLASRLLAVEVLGEEELTQILGPKVLAEPEPVPTPSGQAAQAPSPWNTATDA